MRRGSAMIASAFFEDGDLGSVRSFRSFHGSARVTQCAGRLRQSLVFTSAVMRLYDSHFDVILTLK